jgi:LPS export ABC transporter protein LptC
MGRTRTKQRCPKFPLFLIGVLCWGCSFDYGNDAGEDESQPDIVMKDVEYVRIRDGDPVVRFQAESAERYEKRQTMELKNFSFEQFAARGEDLNAVGQAGAASVELGSGDIRMSEGVHITVDSEDITIGTPSLNWYDEPRFLSGDEQEEVVISRSDGTSFNGRGFSADIRNRTWDFSSKVEGIYVHEDDEEDAEAETDDGDEAGEGPGERSGGEETASGEPGA